MIQSPVTFSTKMTAASEIPDAGKKSGPGEMRVHPFQPDRGLPGEQTSSGPLATRITKQTGRNALTTQKLALSNCLTFLSCWPGFFPSPFSIPCLPGVLFLLPLQSGNQLTITRHRMMKKRIHPPGSAKVTTGCSWDTVFSGQVPTSSRG